MREVNAPILVAVDLGTTNCKAAAFSLDGDCLASESVAYPTQNPREGWYEQRPADWRAAVLRALRSVASMLDERAASVAGLCLSAWGPGLVLLDREGEPLNAASPTWQDVRSLEHGRRLVRDAGTAWVGGGMPLTGFPAKLAWAIDAWPELTADAAHAVGVKDYLLSWLTGSLATEPSSGPYADAWPDAVFDVLGWEAGRLPPVLASTDRLGVLRADLAAALGLPTGVPVLAGLNDGAAATLGTGAYRQGDGVVSLGTNGVLRVLTESPLSAETCLAGSLFRYPVVSRVWACGGFVLSGGSALSWLARATSGSSESAEIERLLDDAASVAAGSDGVSFLPYLVGKGSPRPDPEATAAFLGLRLSHRRAHLTRAVLEGVAFGIREIADDLVSLGLELRRLLVTGGGAASPLWRGILANVLGLSAQHGAGDSTLGSAIVLSVGLGYYPDVSTAVARLVPEPTTTASTPANRGIYQAAYRAYRQLDATTRGVTA